MPVTVPRMPSLWTPGKYERVTSTLSSKEPPSQAAHQTKRHSRFKRRFRRSKKDDDELTVVETPASYFSGAMERLCGPLTTDSNDNKCSPKSSSSSGSWDDTIIDWWNRQSPDDDESKTEAIEVIQKSDKGSTSKKQIEHIEEGRKIKLSQQKVNVKTKRPSIYEEALEMLTQSILIYTFADLRKMAQEKNGSVRSLMKYPITFNRILEDIRIHREDLEARALKFDHSDLEARLQALKDIQTQQKKSPSMMGRILPGNKKQEPVLMQFHDEESTRGMVYGISLNPTLRRVIVVFRGSVTKDDFITDVKFSQKKLPNPVVSLFSNASETVNVHNGFYEYLFQKDDDGKVRIKHVLAAVKKLLKRNRGYQLFCTGHSLGGALATLFGFFAAMDDQIVKNGPVCVYSWASPRVGNFDFRASFQVLERMKRLQHLRITNKDDIVTLLPFMALEKLSLSTSDVAPSGIALYKHCGIHLKYKPTLTSDPPDVNDRGVDPDNYFRLSYAKDRNDEYEGVCPDELKRAVVAGRSLSESILQSTSNFKKLTGPHSCDEYERRLLASKPFFLGTTMDHLYSDKELVGCAVATPIKIAKSSIRFLPKRGSMTRALFV